MDYLLNDTWPNLLLEAQKPWMGLTARMGGRHWLIIGKENSDYLLEDENGKVLKATIFDWELPKSEWNKVVAASRAPNSPLAKNSNIKGARIGNLYYHQDSGEWYVRLGTTGRFFPFELAIEILKEAKWSKAAFADPVDTKEHADLFYHETSHNPYTASEILAADYLRKVGQRAMTFVGLKVSEQTGSGISLHGDKQSTDEMIETIDSLGGDEPLREFVDLKNKEFGTSFPPYDNPWINRGGSTKRGIRSVPVDENLKRIEPSLPEEVPSPGFIFVKHWTSPEDNWAFMDWRCAGVVCGAGGATAHAAVVMRDKNKPAVVSAEAVAAIMPGDHVKIVGADGLVLINGGDPSFVLEGPAQEARPAIYRFVWSNGNYMVSEVDQSNTEREDTLHQTMIMQLMQNGQWDFETGVIGVIYDDWRAEVLPTINGTPAPDQADLEAWLFNEFPDLQVVDISNMGGAYTLAKTAEDNGAIRCPKCGSHSYAVKKIDEKADKADLFCRTCGNEYTREVFTNPFESAWKETTYPTEEYEWAKKNNPDPEGETFIVRGADLTAEDLVEMVVEADGETSESEDKDDSDSNEKKEKSDSDDSEDAKSEEKDEEPKKEEKKAPAGALSSGTRVQVTHPEHKNQRGSIVEWVSTDEDLKDQHYKILLDNGTTLNSVSDKHVKKIKSAALDPDQDRLPGGTATPFSLGKTAGLEELQEGQWYELHSLRYKVPDLVRVVSVGDNQVTAVHEGDENELFPLEITQEEINRNGYTFVPRKAGDDTDIEGINDIPEDELDAYDIRVCANCGRRFDPANSDDLDYTHCNDCKAGFRMDDEGGMMYRSRKEALDWGDAGRAQPDEYDVNNPSTYDISLGDVIMAYRNGDVVLDDGITTFNPIRAWQWLKDNGKQDDANWLAERMTRGSNWKEAKSSLSISEQQELINENPTGRARNADKLNLEGTHYKGWDSEAREEDLDSHFLWW